MEEDPNNDDDDGGGGDGNLQASERCQRVFFLDYEEDLRQIDETSPVGFVLKKEYNADCTHMNAAFLPLLEKSILQCGCDLDLI